MRNHRSQGRRFVALGATLILSATVAGGGVASGQNGPTEDSPGAGDRTYHHQIDGDTLASMWEPLRCSMPVRRSRSPRESGWSSPGRSRVGSRCRSRSGWSS